MLLLLVMMSSAASALAYDACVDGTCHSRQTLVKLLQVHQMALDRRHSILYLQLSSNLNTAFYLTDLKIHHVQTHDTSGLAFDQNNSKLYSADDKNNIYKYDYNTNEIEVESFKPHSEVDKLQYHGDTLYYTAKNDHGLFYFENKEARALSRTQNYKITDFVIGSNVIYFVSEKRVYKLYTRYIEGRDPELVAENEYSLAIDGNDDVYLVDASTNVIMKLDIYTRRPVEYAAYATGSVSQIVFDVNNTIIFHDFDDGTIYYWKPEEDCCSIDAPHEKYTLKVATRECKFRAMIKKISASNHPDPDDSSDEL